MTHIEGGLYAFLYVLEQLFLLEDGDTSELKLEIGQQLWCIVEKDNFVMVSVDELSLVMRLREGNQNLA